MADDDQIDVDALVSGSEELEVIPDENLEPVEEEKELNPSKEVTGYRVLSSDEIAWMNTCKQAEIELGAVCLNVKELAPDVDLRLWALARTHFETGFMYLNRSIAKPEDPFL